MVCVDIQGQHKQHNCVSPCHESRRQDALAPKYFKPSSLLIAWLAVSMCLLPGSSPLAAYHDEDMSQVDHDDTSALQEGESWVHGGDDDDDVSAVGSASSSRTTIILAWWVGDPRAAVAAAAPNETAVVRDTAAVAQGSTAATQQAEADSLADAAVVDAPIADAAVAVPVNLHATDSNEAVMQRLIDLHPHMQAPSSSYTTLSRQSAVGGLDVGPPCSDHDQLPSVQQRNRGQQNSHLPAESKVMAVRGSLMDGGSETRGGEECCEEEVNGGHLHVEEDCAPSTKRLKRCLTADNSGDCRQAVEDCWVQELAVDDGLLQECDNWQHKASVNGSVNASRSVLRRCQCSVLPWITPAWVKVGTSCVTPAGGEAGMLRSSSRADVLSAEGTENHGTVSTADDAVQVEASSCCGDGVAAGSCHITAGPTWARVWGWLVPEAILQELRTAQLPSLRFFLRTEHDIRKQYAPD